MSSNYTSTDFVILGGGIAGLSVAIGLQKIGIHAKIYEGTPEFKPLGAGLGLGANALKAYEHLGIANKICSAGNALSNFSILRHDGRPISSTTMSEPKLKWPNIAIHRADLHEVLYSELAPDQVVFGKKSVSVSDDGNMKVIHFQDGSTIKAKYVICGEGIHSAVRKQLLPKSRERYAGYTCWRGIARTDAIEKSQTSETWGSNGRFGIVPLNHHRVYWFAVKNAPANSSEMKALTLHDLEKNFKDYHLNIQKVLRATQPKDVIWNDIIDLKPINQFAFGRILLLGDAAHATTPNMGQGACMAIEDAAVLSHLLTRCDSPEDAFKLFESARIKRVQMVVNRSWALGRVAQWENPLAIGLRNTLLKATPKSVSERQLNELHDFKLPPTP